MAITKQGIKHFERTRASAQPGARDLATRTACHLWDAWINDNTAHPKAYRRAWQDLNTAFEAGNIDDISAAVWDPLESTCRHASLSIL